MDAEYSVDGAVSMCGARSEMMKALDGPLQYNYELWLTHYLLHLGICAQYVNPSLGACWAGEDLMLIVRRLVKSCSFGVRPAKGQASAMEKYAFALHLELQFADDRLRSQSF